MATAKPKPKMLIKRKPLTKEHKRNAELATFSRDVKKTFNELNPYSHPTETRLKINELLRRYKISHKLNDYDLLEFLVKTRLSLTDSKLFNLRILLDMAIAEQKKRLGL